MIFEIKRIIFILACILNGYKLSAGFSSSDESYSDWNWYYLDGLETTTIFDTTNIPEMYEIKLLGTHIPILNEEIFESNSNLRRIELNNNKIRLMDTQTFNNFNETLDTLEITSNNLNTFNIEPIWKLKHLNLTNNSLTTLNNINFQKMSLLSLDVSHNKLTEIYCYNVQNIINLSHNNISNICRFSKTILQITLSYNNIKNIENSTFIDLKELRVLDLSHNQIVDLGNSFKIANSKLLIFNLSYNNLTKFEVLQFNYLKTLNVLNLSYNNISVVTIYRRIRKCLNYYNDDKECLWHLNELYLEGNPIREVNLTYVLRGCPNLRKISISFLEISCSTLQHYITELHGKIVKGPFRKEENINGIRCNSSMDTLDDSDTIYSMLYTLERIEAILIVLAVFSAIFVIVSYVVTVKRARAKIVTC